MLRNELDDLERRIGRERGRAIIIDPDLARRLVAAARQLSAVAPEGGAVVRLVVADTDSDALNFDLKSDPGFPSEDGKTPDLEACTPAQRAGYAAMQHIAGMADTATRLAACTRVLGAFQNVAGRWGAAREEAGRSVDLADLDRGDPTNAALIDSFAAAEALRHALEAPIEPPRRRSMNGRPRR